MVAGAFVGVFFGVSTILPQTIGVFIAPLTAEFGWARTQVSLLQVIVIGALVIASPIAGYLLDRFSIRVVTSTSALLMGLSLSAAAFVPISLPILYTIYGVSALLGSGTTPTAFVSIVSRWFDERRGVALGVVWTGVGFAVALLPLAASEIASSLGWRWSFLMLGTGAAIVAAPVMALLLRDRPRVSGDCSEAASSAPPQGPSDGRYLTFGAAFRGRDFWILAGAFIGFGAAFGGIIIHLVPLLSDRGVSPTSAAFAMSVLGAASIAGRLVVGFLLDRTRPIMLAISIIGTAGLAELGLGLGLAHSWLPLLIVLIGFANGAEVDILSYLVSRTFGLTHFAKIYSVLFAAFTLGGAGGGVLLARSYDLSGTYATGLCELAAAIALGCAVLCFVPAGWQRQGRRLATA